MKGRSYPQGAPHKLCDCCNVFNLKEMYGNNQKGSYYGDIMR